MKSVGGTTFWITFSNQACSQGGGGVGGVPTTPSGINDIHNFNYLIQERPFDLIFLQHTPSPLDIYVL